MGKQWEQHKEEIFRLYIEEGRTLTEVKNILGEKYTFEACKRAYQNQIETWGFKKNVRSSDMKVYLEHTRHNKTKSDIAGVLDRETLKNITDRKARRFEKREAAKRESSISELDYYLPTKIERFKKEMEYDYPRILVAEQEALPPYIMPTTTFDSFDITHTTMPMVSNAMYRYPSLLSDTSSGYSTGSSLSPFTMPLTSPAFTNDSMLGYAPSYGIPYDSPDLTGISLGHDVPQISDPSLDYTSRRQSTPLRGNRTSWAERRLDVQNLTAGDLLSAAFQGHTSDLEKSLRQGNDVNHIDEQGNTALHYLVKGMHSHLKTVAQESRTLATPENPRGDPFIRCLELLLKYGANPTIPNFQGDYPLHMAIMKLAGYVDGPYSAADQVRKPWAMFVQLLSKGAHEKMLGNPSRLNQN